IVTDHQIPDWYEKSAFPNITFIDHQTIFPIKSHLPTFNSHSIESNLHRIPGLSENFIYLNDDVFLGDSCTYEDFFDEYNRSKIFLDPCNSRSGKPTPHEIGYRSAWKNTNALLDKWFVREKRKKTAHAPFVINQRIIKQLWGLLETELLRTSAQPFRSIQDYSLVASIYPYFSLYLAHSVESDVKTKTVYLEDNMEDNLAALVDLNKSKYKFFCLEDSSSDKAMDQIVENFLIKFFETNDSAESTASENWP
ncbi:MAG: stealth conserved region 3 domain-containing protein, partial [Bdellovibrionia bacterium]